MDKEVFIRKNDEPKYIQLYNYFRHMILEGVLNYGTKMPSVRKCAEEFSLSRTTVETAYNQLAAEGYIIAKAQSGYYVCRVDLKSDSAYKMQRAKKTENQRQVKFDMVSASADRESFNFSLWRRYVKSALRQDSRLLSYGEYQGEYDLREAICGYVNSGRNVACVPEQIIIGAGTQSLLHILYGIIGRVDSAAFIGAVFEQGKAVFEDYGTKIYEYPDFPENFDSLKKNEVGLIYASPSHMNSWGEVLSIGQRVDILSFAKENDCIIVEDDYDSEFRYYSKPVPSLQGIDSGRNVVYLGTFSKLLIPSIRISFMVLPVRFLEEYANRGKLYNQTASKAEQIALCQYIRDGHLNARIRKQRKQFLNKSKLICKQAEKYFDSRVAFSMAQAGYLVKIEARLNLTAEVLAKKAMNNGVLIAPIDDSVDGTARFLISTAGIENENIDEMLSLLKDTFENESQE